MKFSCCQHEYQCNRTLIRLVGKCYICAVARQIQLRKRAWLTQYVCVLLEEANVSFDLFAMKGYHRVFAKTLDTIYKDNLVRLQRLFRDILLAGDENVPSFLNQWKLIERSFIIKMKHI